MIGFLFPAAAAGLVALAVPLAIHLWSHRARKPVRLGTLAFLSGAPPASARSVRLRDPWLLALRLALLAALVGSLAQPWWAPAGRGVATWALLADEALADRALIDSLRASGAELRLLAPGLPPLDQPQRADAAPPALPSLWSLLREADRLAPAGTAFVVAAPLTTAGLRGERPAIAARVTFRRVAPRAERCGVPGVVPDACAAAPIRRVTVLADGDHAEDARYVQAALRAAATTTGLPVSFTRDTAADWIVWLATNPPPAGVLARARAGAVLFSTLASPRDVATARPVRFRSATVLRAASCPSSGATVWADATGAPLLSVTRLERGRWYRFCGRLHPAAGDLVLRPDFPEAVAALWAQTRGFTLEPAPVPVTAGQARPNTAPARPSTAPPAGAVALTGWLWALAVALFGLERLVALRRRRSEAAA